MSITRERLNEITLNFAHNMQCHCTTEYENGNTAEWFEFNKAELIFFAAELLKAIEAELEVVGYALYREGRQVGIERTLACANHWVEAEIVPIYAIPFIEAT